MRDTILMTYLYIIKCKRRQLNEGHCWKITVGIGYYSVQSHMHTQTDTLTILLTDLIQINNTSNRFFDVNFGYPSTNRLNKVSIKYIDVIDNQLASQYLIQLAIINLTIHSRNCRMISEMNSNVCEKIYNFLP